MLVAFLRCELLTGGEVKDNVAQSRAVATKIALKMRFSQIVVLILGEQLIEASVSPESRKVKNTPSVREYYITKDLFPT